jgi:hypothetical protein
MEGDLIRIDEITIPFTNRRRTPMDWLKAARGLPVTKKELIHHKAGAPGDAVTAPMTTILGAVLHHTHTSTAVPQTLDGIWNSWASLQGPTFQSAHFVIDRDGRIGQFRPLDKAAAHTRSTWNAQYIGIEHIALWPHPELGRPAPEEPLIDPQVVSSATLLSALKSEVGLSLTKLSHPGATGVGVHTQFPPDTGTECGLPDFVDRTGAFRPTFDLILQLAILFGRWEVKVGDWTWIYEFKGGASRDSGTVDWQAFDLTKPNSQGSGKWALDPPSGTSGKLRINWDNGSVEEWDRPLKLDGQPGRLTVQSGPVQPKDEDARKILARRID